MRSKLAQCRDGVKTATQNLADVATRVEEGQPTAAPFALARTAYLTARSEHQQLLDQITNSPQYKDAYAQAVASSNRTVLMPQVKRQYIDENADVVRLRTRWPRPKRPTRSCSKMCSAATPTGFASKAVDEAKAEEDRSEKELRDATAKLTGSKRLVATAQAGVNAMEAALRNDREAIKRIPHMHNQLNRQIDNDRRERQRLR